jgi:Notch-like protein
MIAKSFNTYFLLIAGSVNNHKNNHEDLNNSIKYLTSNSSRPFPNIIWQYTSTTEIEQIIKSIRTKNSYGSDEVSFMILKLSTQFIISPLTYVCNKPRSTGLFPDMLKNAIVKPIFINGNKYGISNYRPVSLLTTFCKIFEKVIYTRIQTRLEKYSILVSEQYGFRGNTFTEKKKSI